MCVHFPVIHALAVGAKGFGFSKRDNRDPDAYVSKSEIEAAGIKGLKLTRISAWARRRVRVTFARGIGKRK